MYKYLIVSCGAAVGGAFRYWMSNFVYLFLPSYFPYGTLAVNVLGSFILGIIIFYFDDHGLINQSLKLFLTVGFCGGFTTFSTFSLETVNLIKSSEFFFAIMNVFLNLFLCLAGVYIAYLISK
jgi:CrcB protein